MNHIIINGQAVEVPFKTEILLNQVVSKKRTQGVRQIIVHHDAALSAVACVRILKSKGLGTHFIIDNDGLVVQLVDPAYITWHCLGQVKTEDGRKEVSFNHRSIGIDISNAVLPKYASKYNPKREEITQLIHGKPVTGLAPYEYQLQVASLLVDALCQAYSIPKTTRKEMSWSGYITPSTPGVYGHLHVARTKIDPFGVNFDDLINSWRWLA